MRSFQREEEENAASRANPGAPPIHTRPLLLSRNSLRALIGDAYSAWREHKGPRLGAALAYYTVFALAPLLVIAIAVAGLVFGNQAAQGDLFAQIQGALGDAGAQAIQAIVLSARRPVLGTFAGIVGALALSLGASSVFVELQDALNTIWGVSARRLRFSQIVKNRCLCFAMVVAIGFLLLLSLLSSVALASLGEFAKNWLPVSEPLLHVVGFVISVGVTTVLFAMMFKLLPKAYVAWSDVWVGSAATALLFEIGKLPIGLYLGKSSMASSYGAASSLVIILAWVYYSAQILYFGAEFTKAYASLSGLRDPGMSVDQLEPRVPPGSAWRCE